MPAYLQGGTAAFTTTPTSINTSGVDRFVLLHCSAASSASISVYIDAGTTARPLVPWSFIPASESRDFGPYFIDDTYSVRVAADAAIGYVYVDEERP